MLRNMLSQLAFVNGERFGNVTLADDAATSPTQGEMNQPSLPRLRIADFPSLFSGEDQVHAVMFHYKHHLRGTPQGTPLTSQFLLLSRSGVAAVTNDSVAATVTNDSLGGAVATAVLSGLSRVRSAAPFCTSCVRVPISASNSSFT